MHTSRQTKTFTYKDSPYAYRSCVHTVINMDVDLGILMETKVTDGIYT
jgi:hypothetical protein